MDGYHHHGMRTGDIVVGELLAACGILFILLFVDSKFDLRVLLYLLITVM
jgi:hypothetical protein